MWIHSVLFVRASARNKRQNEFLFTVLDLDCVQTQNSASNIAHSPSELSHSHRLINFE